MSQGLFLVCHTTRQEVHIHECGGFGVRGADDDLVVAAFCDAHAFRHQLVVLGEERDDDREEYVLWTVENAEQQHRLIAGRGSVLTPSEIAKAIWERSQEWEREHARTD